jgi:hypothetical protein
MAATYGLYAYGLVSKSTNQPEILGIDKKHNVYPVEGKDICVMVSQIDSDQFQLQINKVFSELHKSARATPSETQEILQAHENVVTSLMKGRTIVPFKFGTILKDEQAASQMLHDDEEKFKKLLSKFAGREEWEVKVYADLHQFIQYAARTELEFKTLEEKRERLARGVSYLLGRKMEKELKSKAVTQLAKITVALFQELGEDAFEAKLNKILPQKLTGKKKEMVLNTVYLVEQKKVYCFCEHGKSLLEKYEPMGLDLEISGPRPPYNFT